MGAAAGTADELIWLSDELLRHCGVDIDADHRMVRCIVMSGFLIATCSVQPDVTVYRIMQLDSEHNISQLFAATRDRSSATTDLKLFRDGPWEETFRKIGSEMIAHVGLPEPPGSPEGRC